MTQAEMNKYGCFQEVMEQMEASLKLMEDWAKSKGEELPSELKRSVWAIGINLGNLRGIARPGWYEN
jgi:hypothetical protein